MGQTRYENYFFDASIPFANCERVKAFIADQFGFTKSYINVLRSHSGQLCYPLFKDKNNNYLVFKVMNYTYSCINGELQMLNERR